MLKTSSKNKTKIFSLLMTSSLILPSGNVFAAEITETEIENNQLNEIEDTSNYYEIVGKSNVTANQLAAFFKSKADFPQYYEDNFNISLMDFCQLYIDECKEENIKPEVAFAQMSLETNYLKYTGRVPIDANNFAGMGAVDTTQDYKIYETVKEGIRAQIQHLKAYATTDKLKNECIDDRFKYVQRGCAAYVEWLGIQENPIHKGWASSKDYGSHLRDRIEWILETEQEKTTQQNNKKTNSKQTSTNNKQNNKVNKKPEYSKDIQTSKRKEISFDNKWEYAEFSKINDGKAILYKADQKNSKNITICINAGHGTKGGSKVKTYSHPDKSPKTTGGTTTKGEIMSTAISSGMTFNDNTAESKVTLQIALILKEKLLNKGYDVLLIRETDDVQLDNVARTVIANNNADCHISLHWDGDGLDYDKGCFAIRVPEGIKEMVPVKNNWEKSDKLAELLEEGLRNTNCKINKNKVAIDLTQTSYSTIPSVDLELGNATSKHDDETLNNQAEGIVNGIEKFFVKK